MADLKKIIFVVVVLLLFAFLVLYTPSVDSIDSDENAMILSVCTADMRGLETGLSVYASLNDYPLVLTDSEVPDQLSNYLDLFINQNDIRKIVIAGDMNTNELIKFRSMNLEVERINGDSISEILTNLANNTDELNNDTLIFTASDPMAGLLGAYTKTPVFITASDSSYDSSDTLDDNYKNYLDTHDIKHIIIVGNLPDLVVSELSEYNATIEQLTGSTSSDVSIAVNNKLRSMGYLEGTTTAYYGFFGEIPTIIPNVVKDNAMLIEDSTGDSDQTSYLNENNITDIIFTRNKESDYIQMEEEDFISSDITNQYEEDNFTVEYLSNKRTLDEATGLYDMKINTLEHMFNQENNNLTNYNNSLEHKSNLNMTFRDSVIESKPPLLSLLDYSSWIDSNNISLTINEDGDNYTAKWSTIHPYSWIKNNDTSYTASSNTGYVYKWNYDDSKWNVDYYYNDSEYFHVEFIRNNDNTWTEVEPYMNYTWQYSNSTWYCYDNSSSLVYYIQKT